MKKRFLALLLYPMVVKMVMTATKIHYGLTRK